ncbi:MAG: outer membrane protein assembly factor BamE [Pseudomonas sp.]|uniref:outer membrane protein assembly factor BamE n=1 Tax=Pseudomonas abieticivorans TaxID=2931382 RepID=UPI0020BD8B62|nr:outer membrane protein assembly factor BamE [Pseudomonas sp. PIA16]MDE1164514.1 outer membrane protein assembly factor BamE [Pseudomonas sp.]
MQNTKHLLTSLTLVGLLALAGCSFPGVYKIDIQQGNVVTQDMIDQLRPGMTRRQVRFIMGNPLLVDTFHANRWDYLYSMQPGGGERQQERMSIFFNGNDQLSSLSGDFMPGVSKDQAILGQDGAAPAAQPADNAEKPKAEAPPKPGSLLDDIQRSVDDVKTTPVPTPTPLDTSPQ